MAWVYCRTTDNIVAVRLTPDGERALRKEIEYVAEGAYRDRLSPWGPFAFASLQVAVASESFALGRRLFYDANEPVVSEQMACAGCHPDGRDDGQSCAISRTRAGSPRCALGRAFAFVRRDGRSKILRFTMARQTWGDARRLVSRFLPHGWHGESVTLVDRIARASRCLVAAVRTDWLTIKRRPSAR